MNQQSFADIEYANRKRKTKRDEFLEMMDELIPWDEWVAMIEPHYFSGKRGRPPRGIETMLRMYLLANWFSLSDEGVEDAIYDSYAFRTFMGVDFCSNEQAPDATTLCKFRGLLHESGIAELIFVTVKDFLDRHGKLMRGGTILDATLIDAPSSTKNAEKKRDPEMHQTKKGNQWYFGEKLHIAADAGTGYIHDMEVTAANVPDVVVAPDLLREDDHVMYGDSAYTGIEKREEVVNDETLSAIEYRVTAKKPYRRNKWESGPGIFWHKQLNYQKSRVRSKVEYAFLVIKRIFGYRKVRYRGLAKNRTHAYLLCACANLYMLGRSGWLRASS